MGDETGSLGVKWMSYMAEGFDVIETGQRDQNNVLPKSEVVTPRSLTESERLTEEPETSTIRTLFRVRLLLWVPSRIASDFSGLSDNIFS